MLRQSLIELCLGIKTSAWAKFIDESDDAENVDVHVWLEAAYVPSIVNVNVVIGYRI